MGEISDYEKCALFLMKFIDKSRIDSNVIIEKVYSANINSTELIKYIDSNFNNENLGCINEKAILKSVMKQK
jgi:hypothetical protein